MGTPSDGKEYAPDRLCDMCSDILWEDEGTTCGDCLGLEEKAIQRLDNFIKKNEETSMYLYKCCDDDIRDSVSDYLSEILSAQVELAKMIKSIKIQLDK